LVGSKEAALQKVTTDLGLVLERIPIETGERADLLKIYDTHTMTLQQLKERIALLEHDVTDITHTKQTLQASYTQAIEAHKTEAEHLEAANAAYSEISSKVKEARKENDVLYQEVLELQKKIKELSAEDAQVAAIEGQLAEKEAAEAAELAALREKEKAEREEIANLKRAILEAKHTLQGHEGELSKHKQTHEKLSTDHSTLSQHISIRESEISGVLSEYDETHKQYIDVTKNTQQAQTRIKDLEYKDASLAHLHDDLDQKIKDLAHKEATEHHELEANSAKLHVLAIELDHLRAEIAKAKYNLESKQKDHEGKTAQAEIDIKTYESELSHRAEVHKHKEKDVAVFTKKASKHKNHDKKRQHDKKKKKVVRHYKKAKQQYSSSSSSSSWSD
jgi:myosin heavy subunit